jgi:hypothetical protein
MEASPAAYPRGMRARGTPRTPARGGARRRVSTPPPPGSGGIARPARRLDGGLVSPEGASLWPRRAQPRARAVDARLTRHTAFDRAMFLPAEARRAGAPAVSRDPGRHAPAWRGRPGLGDGVGARPGGPRGPGALRRPGGWASRAGVSRAGEGRPRRAGAAPPLRLPRPGEATGLRPPAAADGRRAQPSVAGAAAPRHGALHASP